MTDRIAVGGGIWNDENMAALVKLGVTHIINMQIEFDDRPLAEPYPVQVLHNPTDDDFLPKPPRCFRTECSSRWRHWTSRTARSMFIVPQACIARP